MNTPFPSLSFFNFSVYYHAKLQTIMETPDFCVKVYFCLIVRFFPQSPSYQRHLKTRKNGVHQPFQCTPPSLKTLDFKPFFNTFACEYPKSYGINSRLPPVPLLDYDDFYPSLPHLPHPIRHSTNRALTKHTTIMSEQSQKLYQLVRFVCIRYGLPSVEL